MAIRVNSQRGVTLVELIITIAVCGILLAIATPSFRKLLKNWELKSTAESVYQGLQLARAEAVRRNSRVRFVVGTDTSWTVSTDAGVEIQSRPAKEGAPTASASFTPTASRRVTFNSFGRVVANADSSAALTQINFAASGATASRRLTIETGGKIGLCDPNVVSTSDPYKC